MAAKIIYLAVTVKEKDKDGRLPRSGEVAINAQDILNDSTKHDVELPWRVTSITEIRVPSAGVQVGNDNYQHNNFG